MNPGYGPNFGETRVQYKRVGNGGEGFIILIGNETTCRYLININYSFGFLLALLLKGFARTEDIFLDPGSSSQL